MKKINSLLVILTIMNFTYCQHATNERGNMSKIEKVQVKSVDFSIMTFLTVECDKFEDYFKEYRMISTTDTVLINELLSQIVKFEPIDSTYSKSVDTRAKIKLFSKSDTNTICVGSLTLSMNNKIYKTPQGLIDFIEKIE